jgi:hypothetical protein
LLVKNTQQGRDACYLRKTNGAEEHSSAHSSCQHADKYYTYRLCCVFFTNKPTRLDKRFRMHNIEMKYPIPESKVFEITVQTSTSVCMSKLRDDMRKRRIEAAIFLLFLPAT